MVFWPAMFVRLVLLFVNIGPLNAAMANVLPAELRARLRADDDAHAPARRRGLAVAHRRGVGSDRARDPGAPAC
jgi:hypothetical protein